MSKKKLCKLEKEKGIEKDPEAFARIVNPPRFRCKKCGRVANSEEWLHEPVPLRDALNCEIHRHGFNP